MFSGADEQAVWSFPSSFHVARICFRFDRRSSFHPWTLFQTISFQSLISLLSLLAKGSPSSWKPISSQTRGWISRPKSSSAATSFSWLKEAKLYLSSLSGLAELGWILIQQSEFFSLLYPHRHLLTLIWVVNKTRSSSKLLVLSYSMIWYFFLLSSYWLSKG